MDACKTANKYPEIYAIAAPRHRADLSRRGWPDQVPAVHDVLADKAVEFGIAMSGLLRHDMLAMWPNRIVG
jgi:hypothetical protein